MKWKFIGIIGISVGALLGIGGFAYGADQHKKRRVEKDRFAEEVRKKEKQLADLEVRFGRQSEQFKTMAEDLKRYKHENAFDELDRA